MMLSSWFPGGGPGFKLSSCWPGRRREPEPRRPGEARNFGSPTRTRRLDVGEIDERWETFWSTAGSLGLSAGTEGGRGGRENGGG
eukprot:442761-Rhodomonas_salina.1